MPDELTRLLEKPVLTCDETAAISGLDRKTIYGAAARGDIPTIRIGRRLLVPTAKLRAMLGLDPQPPVEPIARALTDQEAALAA